MGEWDTALKNKYRRLKWKMMLQTMGIMMMSLVVGKVIITLILDGLFQGKLSNLIIGILMKMNLSQAEADVIYQNRSKSTRLNSSHSSQSRMPSSA